jgi:uncharacterized protein (TIGR03000 family)
MRSFLLSAAVALGVMGVLQGRLPAADPEPAVIDVTSPADARLTINGHATLSTSEHRLFVTPPLEAGKTFQYTFNAKFVREGKTITVEQKVLVRPGRETFVLLDPRGAASAVAPWLGSDRYPDGTSSQMSSYYYDPEGPARLRAGVGRAAAAAAVVEFSGRSVSAGGFQPIHYGCDQTDAFYHSGQ